MSIWGAIPFSSDDLILFSKSTMFAEYYTSQLWKGIAVWIQSCLCGFCMFAGLQYLQDYYSSSKNMMIDKSSIDVKSQNQGYAY